jgi:TolB protein
MTKISLLALLVFLGSCTACQPAKSVTPPTTTVPPPTSTVASLSATPTNTPTAHPASEPSLTGWLAFYSDRDGNPEIYKMNADGSGVARLTNDPAFDDSPALSPDGQKIAFLTARHDPNPTFPDLEYELYIMNIDGSNLRRLTTTEAAEDHPAWSPDGNRISFDADYDGDGYYEIYQIQPDGSNLTRLTSGAYNDQFADWAPDGKQISFASDRNGNWDLFVMDADGSNQQAITSSPNWELSPAWAPDGSRIAFNSLVPRSRNTDIFLVNADGSDPLQLTDSPGFDENPAWSPDGSQIAFQTQRSGNFELYVMNPDGSGQRPLAVHPADELWPSWAPSTPSSFEKSSQDLSLRETFQVVLGGLDCDGGLNDIFVTRKSKESDLPAIRKIYGNDEFARPALLCHCLRLAGYLVNMLSVPCF